MSSNTRASDDVRNFLRDNFLTTFNPAVQWEEDRRPFTNKQANIIFCRQQGLPVDAFTRELLVEVFVFSPAGADEPELNAIFQQATEAAEYAKANFDINDDLIISLRQDVTGPFKTGQNRSYYTFTLLCYTE